jgi:hypothetical protein
MSFAKIFPITAVPTILFVSIGCGNSDPAAEHSDRPIRYAKSESATNYDAARPDTDSSPQASVKEFDGIRFMVPEHWQDVDLTPAQLGFIDARFLIPVDGNQLQLTLSSMGGGIDLNVQRWVGQFQLPAGDRPSIEKLSIGPTSATWVDLSGTFRSAVSSNGGAKQNWRMLGVAIPRKPRDFYLKLTGPHEAVDKVRDELRRFVQSAEIDL